jgi:pyridoxamine 5'-phosphate oxidase family protein
VSRSLARFSKAETEYLGSQQIARIATVSSRGQPDLVPVVLEYDGEYFWVGSHSDQARKYVNVKSGNKLVAITIDDVQSFRPWKARALRIYGTADILDHQGKLGHGKYLRITPKVSWGFGLGASDDQKKGHDMNVIKTVH